uniref:Ig-like domain-containing protein n=1 Tax=Echeneis naucrates TaxID=173247 RepID=A0A665VF13_ECHNA
MGLLFYKMKVKFTKPLENVVSLKGRSLTLRCEVNKPKADVQWLKDGKDISPSRRHTIRAQGRERSFTIHQIVEEDAGEYTCESTDDRTRATVILTPYINTIIIYVGLHESQKLQHLGTSFKVIAICLTVAYFQQE